MEDVSLDETANGTEASSLPESSTTADNAPLAPAAVVQPHEPSSANGQEASSTDDCSKTDDSAPPPPPPPKESPAEPIAPLGQEVVASSPPPQAASAPLPTSPAPEPPTKPSSEVAVDPARPPPGVRTESISSEASSRVAPPRQSQSAAPLDRTRTGSTSTISSAHHPSFHSSRGSLSTLPATTLSSIHLSTALTSIGASKEARRSPPLQKAIASALEALKEAEIKANPIDQALILEPLRLACETRSAVLQSTALDCISKLVSHSFFHAGPIGALPSSDETSSTPEVPQRQDTVTVSDHLVAIITSTYTETTPDSVALQIVKSILALVLSPTTPVHHSSLLKAVRTVYNIFLLSADPVNQMVAQGGLTQMVHHVFGRVKVEAGQLGVDGGRGGGSLAHSRKSSSATVHTLMNGSGPSTPTGLGISTVSLLSTTATDEASGTAGGPGTATPIVEDRELQEGMRQPVRQEEGDVPPPIDRSQGVTSPLGHSNPPKIILCVPLHFLVLSS